MSCEIVEIIGTGDYETYEKISKNQSNFATVLASELVSDIIDNALDIVEDKDRQKMNTSGDIFENLSNKFQGLVITEEQRYMEGVPAASSKILLEGIGDQLQREQEIEKEAVIKHPPVEKKNRLSDLVKNSKQLLTKIMHAESKAELSDAKSEKVVKVVDLDAVEVPYKVKKILKPEDVLLPGNDSDEILQSPSEDEEPLEEIQLHASHNKDRTPSKILKKTMTFPLAGSSRKLMERYRTLKFTGESPSKKKWNVGGKIMDYIRRQRAKRQSADAKDGIEISPHEEE
uniref:Uncharacterized protein LOC114332847 n=1 Tax=Diabrotica virgifera virgifera TaxID=50390 RepID=A0A6P7FQC1_DIAVI